MALEMTATWWQVMVPPCSLMSSMMALRATILAVSSKASRRVVASSIAWPAWR